MVGRTCEYVSRVRITVAWPSRSLTTFVSESSHEDRDMEGHALAAVRLYSHDPSKVKAIMFRLEALANLLVDEGAPGWTLSLSNGAVLTQEPVFAAAAVQPSIEQGGNVVFDRESFLDKVLELAELDEIG